MAHVISEIKREGQGHISPKGNVLFDTESQVSPGIVYNPQNGEITFNELGLYSIKWWIATETSPRGAMEFELTSGETYRVPGCSPIKTGQVSGFGVFDVKTVGTKLWLASKVDEKIIFSIASEVRAYMLITQVSSANPGGLIGVYHANLSTPGSFREVTVENVVYRIQYDAGNIELHVKSTAGTVVVDIKRSTQYGGGGVEGQSLNNYNLTTSLQLLDDLIYNVSNEMHRTWIRQQDPVSGLWSMYEVDLFASSAGARVSICVYLIYESMDLSGL